ncbi:MAG: hypothetical protein N3J91_05910 [Verrucomicrobiae bacterium]|nr:hypothetical protein [Verrucomicrobiae bacterium]
MMNLKKAVAIAGIGFNVSGKQGAIKALQHIKEQIVQARREGDDARAAELSEVKEFFKRRRRSNFCQQCNAIISRNATHCRMCSRNRRPTLPGPKGDTNAMPYFRMDGRLPFDCSGGWKALYGFYSKAVQKVWRKYALLISPDRQNYIFSVAVDLAKKPPENSPETDQFVRVPIDENERLACLELAKAILQFRLSNSIEAWLIEDYATPAINGRFPTWTSMAQKAQAALGRPITPEALRKTAARLKLLPSKEQIKEFKQMFGKAHLSP